MSSNHSFKNTVTNKLFTYKYDLALNNPQGFICHKTPNNLSLRLYCVHIPPFSLSISLSLYIYIYIYIHFSSFITSSFSALPSIQIHSSYNSTVFPFLTLRTFFFLLYSAVLKTVYETSNFSTPTTNYNEELSVSIKIPSASFGLRSFSFTTGLSSVDNEATICIRDTKIGALASLQL